MPLCIAFELQFLNYVPAHPRAGPGFEQHVQKFDLLLCITHVMFTKRGATEWGSGPGPAGAVQACKRFLPARSENMCAASERMARLFAIIPAANSSDMNINTKIDAMMSLR